MTGFKRTYGDLLIVVLVLCISALLLVPVPTQLIDFLIAFNIGFSLLLLLIGLSLPNALALLSFPTLLLLTTLFRLSLNVASTRLILSQADAGVVISAFGSLLIRGEIAVGLIIFTIITIVNFIVIARGATRVSEVAARFVLDALPGKQLAIDADLRAGLISAEDARARREDLRKETQLYGSMDGAMKFVQGDAVACIIIVLINIFGGIYLGVRNGLPFGDALQTYTILTVGDGLVSQIPALLISICAGIVVTRVSSGKSATLSSDLSAQLLQNPKMLYLAAAVIALLGLLPGVPLWPFILSAVVLVAGAFYGRSRAFAGGQSFWPALREVRALGDDSEATLALPGSEAEVARLQVSLSNPLVLRKYQSQKSKYKNWWKELSRQLRDSLGLRLPAFSLTLNSSLESDEYLVSSDNFQIFRGTLSAESSLISISEAHAAILGVATLGSEYNPIRGVFYSSVRNSNFVEDLTVRLGADSLDTVQQLLLKGAAYYLHHPEDLISLTAVHAELKELENRHPGLFAEVIRENFINSARLTEILRELVRQRFPVTDFKLLVELLAAYCSSYGAEFVRNNEYNLDDIVGFIRRGRKRSTCSNLSGNLNSIKAVNVSPDLYSTLLKVSATANADYSLHDTLAQSFENLYKPLQKSLAQPLVLLVPPELRARVWRWIQKINADVPVLATDEIDPSVKVEILGIWNQ